ncbi:MAG TPA: hypothetical protein VFJ61_06690 [Solirubrobacterales bacterium]|nr:hypothetical protein [Solirubrobacterales bacterium]
MTVLLTGCGGGQSDEEKIAEVIETSATSTDPQDCPRLTTLAYREQTQHAEVSDAKRLCREDARETENDPTSVEVSGVRIKGDKATADVAYIGGIFDGQTMAVALVKRNDAWKMDEVTGFSRFDRARLVRAMSASLSMGPGAFRPEVATCLEGVFAELPRPKLEEIVIGDSVVPFEELVVGCT